MYLGFMLVAGLIILLGFFVFYKALKSWKGKLPDYAGFLELLVKVTIGTALFVVGFAVLIAGVEASQGKYIGLEIKLDGQTIVGLFSLLLAIPVAFASAIVVILLGKAQSDLAIREMASLELQNKDAARKRLHETEIRLIAIFEAFAQVTDSLTRLYWYREEVVLDLFNKYAMRDPETHELVWYKSTMEHLREDVALELRTQFQFPTEHSPLQHSTEPQPATSFFSHADSQRTSESRQEEYERAIWHASESAVKLRMHEALQAVPEVSMPDDPKLEKVFSKFRDFESQLLNALERLKESLRDGAFHAETSMVWQHSTGFVLNETSSFLSRLKKRCDVITTTDRRTSKYLSSATAPSLHLLQISASAVLNRVRETHFSRSVIGASASQNEAFIKAHFSTVHHVLEQLNFPFLGKDRSGWNEIDDLKVGLGALQASCVNQEIACREEKSKAGVDANPKHEADVAIVNGTLSFNQLGLFLAAIAEVLPSHINVLDALDKRELLKELDDEDRILSSLPLNNEYRPFMEAMKLENYLNFYTGPFASEREKEVELELWGYRNANDQAIKRLEEISQVR